MKANIRGRDQAKREVLNSNQMPLVVGQKKAVNHRRVSEQENRPKTPVVRRHQFHLSENPQPSSSSQRSIKAKSTLISREQTPKTNKSKGMGESNLLPKYQAATKPRILQESKEQKIDLEYNTIARESRPESLQDQEGELLLESLRQGCNRQFDPAKLTNRFVSILSNSTHMASDSFMPKDKYERLRDGRQCMKLGDTTIFFDDSVIGSIINFGMRSKVSANAAAT